VSEPSDRRGDALISANGDIARTSRLEELMASRPRVDRTDFQDWQHDVVSWTAGQLVPLLSRARATRPDVEAARARLLAWDRRVSSDSTASTLYVRWERALVRMLAQRAFGESLARDYMDFVSTLPASVLERLRRQDDVLIDALVSAVDDQPVTPDLWGALHKVLFAHPLAVTESARRRFNVGPFPIGGYSGTVMATFGRGLTAEHGPSFREILDVGDWDRSLSTNAPGQAESPSNPHFADLARGWAAGEYFPLVFSEVAVKANTEATLTLIPR
jgi:penicillin G amidase